MASPTIGAAVKRAREAIRRIKAMEREDLAEVRAILANARGDLLARLADGGGTEWSQVHAITLLREVDAVSNDLDRSLGDALLSTQSKAQTLAVENTAAMLKAQGIEPLPSAGSPVVNINAIMAAQTEAVADMITGVTEEFRTATRRDLRRALSGGLSVRDFERRLGSTLPGPGVFGTVAKRAEVIVRNETADAFQIASEVERKNLGESGFVFRKRWVTSRDGRVRPSHAALDGVTVDAEEDFLVGGFPAAYPKDPRLPAGESINCRCVVVTEIDAEQSAAGSGVGATFGGRSNLRPLQAAR